MPFSLPPQLTTALVALADRLDAAAIPWVVSGSVARALVGFAGTPRDLDIEMAPHDVRPAAACLGITADTASDDHVTSIRAQGVWHGVEVDVSGGLTFDGPGGVLVTDFALLARFATPVDVERRTVLAAPVEEQIARWIVAGTPERLDRIADERPAELTLRDDYLMWRLASAASASR